MGFLLWLSSLISLFHEWMTMSLSFHLYHSFQFEMVDWTQDVQSLRYYRFDYLTLVASVFTTLAKTRLLCPLIFIKMVSNNTSESNSYTRGQNLLIWWLLIGILWYVKTSCFQICKKNDIYSIYIIHPHSLLQYKKIEMKHSRLFVVLVSKMWKKY